MQIQDYFIDKKGQKVLRTFLERVIKDSENTLDIDNIPRTYTAYERAGSKWLAASIANELMMELETMTRRRGSISLSYYEEKIEGHVKTKLRVLLEEFHKLPAPLHEPEKRSENFCRAVVAFAGSLEKLFKTNSLEIFTNFDISDTNLYQPEKAITGLFHITFKELLLERACLLEDADPEVAGILHKLYGRLEHRTKLDIGDLKLFLKARSYESGIEVASAVCTTINELMGQSLTYSNITITAGRAGGLDQFRANVKGDIADKFVHQRLSMEHPIEKKPHVLAAEREYSEGKADLAVPRERWVYARASEMVKGIKLAVAEMVDEFLNTAGNKFTVNDCYTFAQNMLRKHIDSAEKQAAAQVLVTVLEESFKNAADNPLRHLRSGKMAEKGTISESQPPGRA